MQRYMPCIGGKGTCPAMYVVMCSTQRSPGGCTLLLCPWFPRWDTLRAEVLATRTHFAATSVDAETRADHEEHCPRPGPVLPRELDPSTRSSPHYKSALTVLHTTVKFRPTLSVSILSTLYITRHTPKGKRKQVALWVTKPKRSAT
jgi:hypothetical protein